MDSEGRVFILINWVGMKGLNRTQPVAARHSFKDVSIFINWWMNGLQNGLTLFHSMLGKPYSILALELAAF